MRSRLALALLLVLSYSAPALPASVDQPTDFSNPWMDLRFDWTVTLRLKPLERYLKFPASRLDSILMMEAKYRINPRLAPHREDKAYPLEIMWYQRGNVVGCRRLGNLDIKPTWQGAILVPPGEGKPIAEHMNAVAHEVVRLLLEVSSRQGIVVTVLAPPEMVVPLCDALGKYSFYRTATESMEFGPSGIHILVASGQKTDRNYMVYKPGG